MIVRELKGIEEMVEQITVLNELYPELNQEEYAADLAEMLRQDFIDRHMSAMQHKIQL